MVPYSSSGIDWILYKKRIIEDEIVHTYNTCSAMSFFVYMKKL
jgi:hypothetical protein